MHAEAAGYGLDMNRVVAVGDAESGWVAETVTLADDPSQFLQECEFSMPEDYRVRAGAVWAAEHLGRIDESYQVPNGFAFFIQNAINWSADDIEALWPSLNGTEPADWRALEVETDGLLALVPYLPTYWADGSDPPLLIGNYVTPSPWFPRSLFVEDAQALGVDVRVVAVPCTGTACLEDIGGFCHAQWDSFPGVIAALDAYLTEVLDGP